MTTDLKDSESGKQLKPICGSKTRTDPLIYSRFRQAFVMALHVENATRAFACIVTLIGKTESTNATLSIMYAPAVDMRLWKKLRIAPPAGLKWKEQNHGHK